MNNIFFEGLLFSIRETKMLKGPSLKDGPGNDF